MESNKLHTLSCATSEACSTGLPEVPKGTAPPMPGGTLRGNTPVTGFLHFLVSRLPAPAGFPGIFSLVTHAHWNLLSWDLLWRKPKVRHHPPLLLAQWAAYQRHLISDEWMNEWTAQLTFTLTMLLIRKHVVPHVQIWFTHRWSVLVSGGTQTLRRAWDPQSFLLSKKAT